MTINEEDLALVIAERAITRVLHRYVQGVDRSTLDKVRGCYWDKAIDSHADIFAGIPDEYVQWLSVVLPAIESISHQFTNLMITADPWGPARRPSSPTASVHSSHGRLTTWRRPASCNACATSTSSSAEATSGGSFDER